MTTMSLPRIHSSELKTYLPQLHAGDQILLSGEVYTARDTAHYRLCQLLNKGEALPFPLAGAIIYYAGPTPAPPGKPIGAIGPTTSGRMDPYTPLLLQHGLLGMIGKGKRNEEVCQAIQTYGAIYFAATGGAAALMSHCVTAVELVAWPELQAEAIKRLSIVDLPLTVINDIQGRDLYREVEATALAKNNPDSAITTNL